MIPMIVRRSLIALLAAGFLSPAAALSFDKQTSVSLSRCIMGGYYERTGEIDKAIDEYSKALKADPSNSHLHLNLAGAYLKKNDIPRATQEIHEAIQDDPEAVEPHAVLALLYFSQNKPAEAGQEYETALKKASTLEPRNMAIYKSLGSLYLERKDLPAAERTFKLVIGLNPSDHESHFFLANILDEQHRRKEAIEELKKTLQIKPDFHPALNYLGYVYVEENLQLDEAKDLIDRAIELDPENGAYIDSRGWYYFRKGRLAEARKDLEKAAGLIEDPVVFDHLGDVYMRGKESDKARQSWEKALSLDPSQESVKKKLESFKAKK